MGSASELRGTCLAWCPTSQNLHSPTPQGWSRRCLGSFPKDWVCFGDGKFRGNGSNEFGLGNLRGGSRFRNHRAVWTESAGISQSLQREKQ